MTNAVYITPHLPLTVSTPPPKSSFQDSLLEYISYYSPSRTGELVERLKKYDFTSVKAEFIASVPGKFDNGNTKWGLARLKCVLKGIPMSEKGELFAQVNTSDEPCLQSLF